MEAEEDQEEDMEAEGEPSGVLIRGTAGDNYVPDGNGNDRWDRLHWDRYVSDDFFADVGVPDIFSPTHGNTRPLCSCVWIGFSLSFVSSCEELRPIRTKRAQHVFWAVLCNQVGMKRVQYTIVFIISQKQNQIRSDLPFQMLTSLYRICYALVLMLYQNL